MSESSVGRPCFRVGINPAPGSRLGFLLELPILGEPPLTLACAVDWPFGKDAYCHPVGAWPPEATIVDEVPVEQCRRSGKAVHLVLRRRQRRRSMFVWTESHGRTVIFWRTQATMASARPGMKVPEARGLDAPLSIAVDLRERHPWRFGKHKATVTRRELPVGDYGVFHGPILHCAVERKTPSNLAGDALGGQLGFALAELGHVAHACVVVEGRLSDVLKAPAEHAGSGWLLSVLAALQAHNPRVPIVFAETRALAEDYAYRWLAAAAKAPGRAPLSAARGSAGGAEGQPDASANGGRPFSAGWDNSPRGVADKVSEGSPGLVAYQPPLTVNDRSARLTAASTLARAGRIWTSADYAEHFGVSRSTAHGDLVSLVAAGSLEPVGSRRNRSYAWCGADRQGEPGAAAVIP